jgi:hypothetical protein
MLSFKLTSASDEIRLDLAHGLIISWYMGIKYIRRELTILELRGSYQRFPEVLCLDLSSLL